MSYERILRPLLFRLDPESVHHAALWAITMGLVRGKLLKDERLKFTSCGLDFPNPLGLAAGVDKDGIAINRWAGMGFGSAEIGTITALPQPGNPRPRLFRYPEQGAVINRMGFNNHGCRDAALALSRTRSTIPIGVNIGKTKVTPLDKAAEDYLTSYRMLAPHADYVVVNVSSPNTPGLRSLQSVEFLREILEPLVGPKPLFVKIAPDLHLDDVSEIAVLASTLGLAGIIATNTTLNHNSISSGRDQIGGLSGRPLKSRSDEVLRHLKSVADPGLTLVGVGGVFDGQSLHDKLSLGATWAQVYTGWVYGGPLMPYRTLLELLEIRNGA